MRLAITLLIPLVVLTSCRRSEDKAPKVSNDKVPKAEATARVGLAPDRPFDPAELGRIALADEEFIRPSPGLVGSIERMARQLHPEVFGAAPAPTSGALPAAEREFATCGR